MAYQLLLHNYCKNIKLENYNSANIVYRVKYFMSEESERELKKQDHEEMKEESHQLELKEGYEQDEKYDESEE